jgi:hypothetical protein
LIRSEEADGGPPSDELVDGTTTIVRSSLEIERGANAMFEVGFKGGTFVEDGWAWVTARYRAQILRFGGGPPREGERLV